MSTQKKKQSLLNNAFYREIFFQVLLISAILLFFWFLAHNTMANLEKRGIATGFGFLSQASGFGIIQHLVPYDETYSFGWTFVVGLLNTILVSCVGVVVATLLGFTVGVARLSNNWLIAKLATVYVETFRNIPLLLQIFFWYAILRSLPSPKTELGVWRWNISKYPRIVCAKTDFSGRFLLGDLGSCPGNRG